MLIGHTKQLERLKKLAKSGQLSHGYIFFGEPHIGKRTSAVALANYFETGELDVVGARPLSDVHIISPDKEKQVIGIDAIREMQAFLSRMPNVSAYRTLIIDDAHTLTGEASQALLKITEEPPSASLIIFIVQDPDLLLPTIQSRLEKVYFSSVHEAEIEQWLIGEYGVAKSDATPAAKRSFGAPGLAWRYLFDERSKKIQADARQFFSLRGKERQDFIKKLTEVDDKIPPEDAFHFDRFMEVLLYTAMPLTPQNTEFMKACLKLREQAGYFNLNTRLQLTALAEASQ